MKFSRAECAALALTAGVLGHGLVRSLPVPVGEAGYAVAVQRRDAAPAPSEPRFYVPDGPVDLNTADLSELLTLPGLGVTKAQAILDDRARNGPFAQSQDVIRVSGIGQATYEKMAPYITVSPP